jgi:hypothetical protein
MSIKLENKELLSVGRTASAVLVAHRLVMGDTDPANVKVATANARCVGVVEQHAHIDDPVKVIVAGIVSIEAAGALATIGTELISNGVGQVVAAGGTGLQNIVGIQLSVGAGGSGELVTVLMIPNSRYAEPTGGGIGGAVITVNAEVAHPTHSIECNIQLNDCFAAALAVVGVIEAYLSTDALGKDINATVTPTADLAKGTDGSLAILTAYQAYRLISEADGDIDVVLAKTDGAATVYLNLVLPNGKIITSTAITFSA